MFDTIPELFDAYLTTIPPHNLINYIITPPSERIPITLSSTKRTFIPFVLLFFMAYLARRPGTWVIRMAIAPVAFVATLRTAFGYQWMDPAFNAYNFGSGECYFPSGHGPTCVFVNWLTSLTPIAGLAGIYGATKVLELACAPRGVLKVGEREPGLIENPAIDLDTFKRQLGAPPSNRNGRAKTLEEKEADTVVQSQIHIRRDHGATPAEKTHEAHSRRNPIVSGLSDGAELLATMRGIGWHFGTGTDVYVSQEWRDTSSRRSFALQTLGSWVWYFVAFDVLTCCIQLVPGVGSTDGGSISVFGGEPESSVRKYAIAMTIEFATGLAFVLGSSLPFLFLSPVSRSRVLSMS